MRIVLVTLSMALLCGCVTAQKGLDRQDPTVKAVLGCTAGLFSSYGAGVNFNSDFSKAVNDNKINAGLSAEVNEWVRGYIFDKLPADKALDGYKLYLNCYENQTNSKSNVHIESIKDNTATQVNINSSNPTQIINKIRKFEPKYETKNWQTNGIFYTEIIVKQTSGIWNQGDKFKIGVKLSGPYKQYGFISGMPSARTDYIEDTQPNQGSLYIETTSAPLNEDVVVRFESVEPVTVLAVLASPLYNETK